MSSYNVRIVDMFLRKIQDIYYFGECFIYDTVAIVSSKDASYAS